MSGSMIPPCSEIICSQFASVKRCSTRSCGVQVHRSPEYGQCRHDQGCEGGGCVWRNETLILTRDHRRVRPIKTGMVAVRRPPALRLTPS